MQHKLALQNAGGIYNINMHKLKGYTSKCICPCSKIFHKWHQFEHLSKLNNFQKCDKVIYLTPESFVEHLYRKKKDFYHRIILRIVQTNYSNLVAKLKISTDEIDKQNKSISTFSSIHNGKVTLPSYVFTGLEYDTFVIIK